MAPYGQVSEGLVVAVTKRRRGHFCWSCERVLSNERFSGGGHARHVCRECSRLGEEELEYRQTVRNIGRVLRSPCSMSRRERAFLEQHLQHPSPRLQLYVANLLYEGQRRQAESRVAWDGEEAEDRPGVLSSPHEQPALRQSEDWWDQVRQELAAVLSEMAAGGYVEPSDDELAGAMHERALTHSTG